MKLKYIPNIITLTRMALIVPFVIYLFKHDYVTAFYIYILAGLTDGVDGLLARHFNWQTEFGGFIDPLADKLLVTVSFFSLALLHLLPWWLAILVLLRDFNIMCAVAVWYFTISKDIHFEPSNLSKANTIVQIALVTFCLFELAYVPIPFPLTDALIVITAITTSLSWIDYVWTWGRVAYKIKHSK